MNTVAGKCGGLAYIKGNSIRLPSLRARLISAAVLATPLGVMLGATCINQQYAQADIFLRGGAGSLNDMNWTDTLTSVSGTPGPGDIGLFNSSTGGQTDSVGAPYTIGELQITNPNSAIIISDSSNPLTINGVSNGTANVGIDMSAATQNLTLTTPVVLGNSQTWLIGSGRTLTAGNTAGNGISGGSNNLTIQGPGILGLGSAGSDSYTGITSINGGKLLLTTTATTTNVLNPSSGLALAGGEFQYQGNGGNQLQTFASATVNVGASAIIAARGSGASAGLNVGTISHVVGGSVFLDATNGSSNTATTNFIRTTNSASTLIGGWAVWGANVTAQSPSDFAFQNTLNVTAPTYTNDAWAPGDNTNVTLTTENFSGNTQSLRFNTTTPSTINLTGVTQITSGGILLTNIVSSAPELIPGGTLEGATGADLVINQFSGNGAATGNIPSDVLTINSTIADATTATALTKTGAGVLALGATNTFTGGVFINEGVIQLNCAGAFNPAAPNAVTFGNGNPNTGPISTSVTIVPSQGLTLNGNSVAIASLNTSAVVGTGAATPVVQNANTTPATLTINTAGNATYAGTLQDGAGSALSLVMAGSGSQTFSGTMNYSGSTTVNSGGTLVLNTVSAKTTGYRVDGTLNVAALASSTLTLTAQTLSGMGSINGTVIANGGTVISPGAGPANTGQAGMLTVSNLTLGASSTVNFGLSNSVANSSYINVSSGVLNLPASGSVTLDLYNPGTSSRFVPTPGVTDVYDLFQVNSIGTGATTAFTLGTSVAGFAKSFGISGGYLQLILTPTGINGVWNNSSANGNWTTNSNWVGNVFPHAAGDSATFDTTNTGGAADLVNLNANESLGSLTFNNAGWTIGSNNSSVLTMDNSGQGASLSSTGSNAVSAAISLNDNTTINQAVGGTLTISSGINNSAGTPNLIVNGAGRTALSNSNTYGPAAGAISAGMLTPSIGTTLSGGGTLQLGSNSSLGLGDLAVSGSSVVQAGSPGLNIPNNVIIANGIALTLDNNGTIFTVSGLITDAQGLGSGSGGVSAVGAGTLILSNSNTYGGGTTLTGGTTQEQGPTSLGVQTGAVTFNGGTLQLASGAITIATSRNYIIGLSQAAVFDTNGSTLSNTGGISSVGSTTTSTADGLIKNGLGTLTLGGADTYTGQTVINNGMLVTGTALALENSTLNYNSQGGTFSFGTLAAATFGGLTGSEALALTNTTAAAVTLTIGNNNVTSTYSGLLGGQGGISKTGSGIVTLGATLSALPTGGAVYSGNTTILNGTLVLGGITNISGGTVDVRGTTTGGSANLVVRDSAIVTSTGALAISDAGNGASGGSILVMNSGSLTAPSFVFSNDQSESSNSVTVQDSGTMTVNGTFNLSDTAGSAGETQTVNLNGGTLGVQSFIDTNTASGNAQNAVVNFSGGTLQALASDGGALFFPAATTAARIAADVNVGGAIINTNGNSITIAEPLLHGAGAPDGGVTKSGLGTLTLSASTNAYTGPTNVNSGTLVIAVTGALPKNNSLTISAGATLLDVANSVLPSMTTAGSFNINGSTIIQNSPALSTISAAVQKGFNGGAWNNSSAGAIYSSLAANDTAHLHAIGVIQNDNGSGSILYNTFEGSGTATLNDSDVLLKYTYYGDTDLSGTVDGSDYSRIDTAYLSENFSGGIPTNPVSGWFNGDFNYDGVVNGSDYTLIDNAFNSQTGVIADEIAGPHAVVSDQIGGLTNSTSAVPEPTTLGLSGIGAMVLLGRRRRR